MSIRVRLTVLILLVGVLPTLGAIVWMTAQMGSLAMSSGQVALDEVGKGIIHRQALATSRQIEAYLRAHPEVDLSDVSTVQANRDLATLAVQTVGRTGYTALFGADAVVYYHPDPDLVGASLSKLDRPPAFWSILSVSLDGATADGTFMWEDADGAVWRRYMAIVPVGDTGLRVAATTHIGEFSGAAEAISAAMRQVADVVTRRLVVSAAIVGLVSLGVATFAGVSLTAPLRRMADGVARVMAGEWDAIPASDRKDELGVLSRALCELAVRLQGLAEGLEEQASDRVGGLQAVADISRAATSVLDPDELIHQTVDLVRERFGLYYVGLFLIDEGAQQAVLRAGTGDAGQQMLAQGHQLEIGGSSMIGQCVGRDQARIAMDVGKEAVRFVSPHLPGTRSELALPMRSRGRVIGAMTVQSEEEAAFDTAYVSVLQGMADQVAVAIDNAQLYADAQAAVSELEATQRHLTSQAWAEYAQMGRSLAYETRNAGDVSLGGSVLPEIQQALARRRATVVMDPEQHSALVTPIILRGEVIGALGIQDQDANRRWTDDDLALVHAVVERMGVIADGLRLLDDAQRREADERLVREIADRMRRAPDMDALIKTTVQAMASVLGTSDAFLQLSGPPGTADTGDRQGHIL